MAKDNPPAFPQSLSQEGPFGGMTLLDYFAGQALAGLCANGALREGSLKDVAEAANLLAEAMLAEREARP